jgi:hypothetical protein
MNTNGQRAAAKLEEEKMGEEWELVEKKLEEDQADMEMDPGW